MSPEQLLALWATVWPYIATVCMIASAVDAVFPQPAAGSHWLPLRKIISFVALNVSAASNGSQPSFTTWLLRIVQPLLTAQGLIQADNAAGPAKLDLTVAQVQPQPDPAQQTSGGAVVTILLTMLLSVAALSACSTPPTTTQTQSDLLIAESVFDVTVVGAEVYSALPECTSGQSLCSDPDIKAAIAKAIKAARIAFGQAELAILGCPPAKWRAAQASPPTAPCGTPVEDMDTQGKVLAAARAALATAAGIVPVVQQ